MGFEMDNSYSHSAAGAQTFMQRVYQWMAAGLSLTGVIALWAASNLSVMKALSGGLFFVLMIAELGIVFWLSASIMRISATTAIMGFMIYSALNGLTLSFIFLVYTGTSIASTFFITAGTFVAFSIYGWVTKTDLTSIGSLSMMAVFGIIIASVVNFFLKSPAMYWVITYIGIAAFIGLTAYDTQRLKEIHMSGAGSNEQLAIMGALRLYLDFVNLFLMLLQLFGRRR